MEDHATYGGKEQRGRLDGFRLALSNPRFQLVMLAWATLINAFLFFPDPQAFGIDGHVYRNALDNMLAGRPAYLVPDPVATALSDGRAIYFFPPPSAAVVGGWVGLFPALVEVSFTWNLLAVLAAFAVVRRLVPAVPLPVPLEPRARMSLALLAWLAFPPTTQVVVYASQNSLFLFGLSLLALGLVRGKPATAGAGLALAIVLRASPALFVLPLLVQRRGREIGWTLLFSGAGTIATLWLVGARPWLDFVHALRAGSGVVSSQGYNMAPLVYFFPSVPHGVWIGLTCLGMAAAGRLPAPRMVPAAIAVFLLGWPVQWYHYAVLALVGIALLLDDPRCRLALALSYVAFAVYWAFAWLPASVLLLIAAARPGWVERVQQAIRSRLEVAAAPATGGLPRPTRPRPSAQPG